MGTVAVMIITTRLSLFGCCSLLRPYAVCLATCALRASILTLCVWLRVPCLHRSLHCVSGFVCLACIGLYTCGMCLVPCVSSLPVWCVVCRVPCVLWAWAWMLADADRGVRLFHPRYVLVACGPRPLDAMARLPTWKHTSKSSLTKHPSLPSAPS